MTLTSPPTAPEGVKTAVLEGPELMLPVAPTSRVQAALTGLPQAAEVKVASLHPLIGDLLRQVGGDKVEVVDLIGAKGDPHSFEPQAADQFVGQRRLAGATGAGNPQRRHLAVGRRGLQLRAQLVQTLAAGTVVEHGDQPRQGLQGLEGQQGHRKP